MHLLAQISLNLTFANVATSITIGMMILGFVIQNKSFKNQIREQNKSKFDKKADVDYVNKGIEGVRNEFNYKTTVMQELYNERWEEDKTQHEHISKQLDQIMTHLLNQKKK